jgi:hypothetical protein
MFQLSYDTDCISAFRCGVPGCTERTRLQNMTTSSSAEGANIRYAGVSILLCIQRTGTVREPPMPMKYSSLVSGSLFVHGSHILGQQEQGHAASLSCFQTTLLYSERLCSWALLEGFIFHRFLYNVHLLRTQINSVSSLLRWILER